MKRLSWVRSFCAFGSTDVRQVIKVETKATLICSICWGKVESKRIIHWNITVQACDWVRIFKRSSLTYRLRWFSLKSIWCVEGIRDLAFERIRNSRPIVLWFIASVEGVWNWRLTVLRLLFCIKRIRNGGFVQLRFPRLKRIGSLGSFGVGIGSRKI